MGGRRHNVEWIAQKLAYPLSTLYGWERDDPSKGLPSRATILHVARFYGLRAEEADRLLSACATQRKRPAERARYHALQPDEIALLGSSDGPVTFTVDVWDTYLRFAREAYLAGELRTARRLAESVLHATCQDGLREEGDGLWSSDERRERSRLWLIAWHIFFEASALIEPGDTFPALCLPYLAQARAVASQTGRRQLSALAVHIEGDFNHVRAEPRKALALHLEAMRLLGAPETDPSLAALIQRLILLDGAQFLPSDRLLDYAKQARLLADTLDPNNHRARVLLNEAAGRALGMRGAPDCWALLDSAEAEARCGFPVGYVTSLYSRMVALVAQRQVCDKDELKAVGASALLAASQYGWLRRVEQIRRAASAGGVEFPNAR